MKAFLNATKKINDAAVLSRRMPGAMVTLAGKPFIQHVIEYLVCRGIRTFEIVLCHNPEQVETLLGFGERWGVTIRYHLVKDETEAYQPLLFLKNSDTDILVGNVDTLPEIQPGMVLNNAENYDALFFTHDENEKGTALKWAILSSSFIMKLEEFTEKTIFKLPGKKVNSDIHLEHVKNYLNVAGSRELLLSQEKILKNTFSGLKHYIRETEPGIRISKNAKIHPNAEITAPVYIGENCTLLKGCRIGPGTVIGDNCLIDKYVVAKMSLVMPGTYVGASLDVSNSVIDKNLLIDMETGAEVIINDEHVLSALTGNSPAGHSTSLLVRIASCIILVAASPLLFFLSLYFCLVKKRALFRKHEITRLPAAETPESWQNISLFELWPESRVGTFAEFNNRGFAKNWQSVFTWFLPGLINVAGGMLNLTGVKPRKRSELGKLPEEWQTAVLKSRAGLITEAMLLFDSEKDNEDLYFSEISYSVSSAFFFNTKLVLKFFWRIINNGKKKKTENQKKNRWEIIL